MRNKTTINFRLKTKVNNNLIKQSKSLRYKQNIDVDQEPLNNYFSQQYVSLAQKCNIKILMNQSSQKIKPYDELVDNDFVKNKIRMKTQYARKTSKYKMKFITNRPRNNNKSPSNGTLNKFQSISIFSGSINQSNRSDKQFIFPLTLTKPYKKRQKSLFKDINSQNFDSLVKQDTFKLVLVINKDQQQNNLIKLSNHAKKLLSLKTIIQKAQQKSKYIIKYIKQYVLKQQGCSLSKITTSIQSQQNKKMIKKLIIYERIIVISIINFIIHDKYQANLQQINRSIQIILGFWYQIIQHTYQKYCPNDDPQYQNVKNIINILSQAKLLTKSNLKQLLQTINIKIQSMNKQQVICLQKLNYIISQSEKYGINRSFYQLLTMFSVYIIDLQSKKKINIDYISFFATCPSPYIIKSPNKPYSLVLDLDETLLHTLINRQTKQYIKTIYRPGCQQFLDSLSQYYQIIIFTASKQNYARQVTKNLNSIHHFLFRQHAVRVQNRFNKDLSRIGRNLNNIIIIDDLVSNYSLQKDNGITIKGWQDDQTDKQLYKIKDYLLNLVKNRPKDVRQYMKSNKYESQIIQSKKVTIIQTIKHQDNYIGVQINKNQPQSAKKAQQNIFIQSKQFQQ